MCDGFVFDGVVCVMMSCVTWSRVCDGVVCLTVLYALWRWCCDGVVMVLMCYHVVICEGIVMRYGVAYVMVWCV